jgi:hypothetical protein
MAVRLSKVSLLHQACGAGDIETVQAYISNQKTEFVGGKRVMMFHLDPEGASALSLAAMGGHVAVADLLLRVKMPAKSNADVNGQSISGSSPLMLAAQNGHVDIVRLLLTSGADVHALNKVGETALHYAARNRDSHTRSIVMQALTEAGADMSVLNAKGLAAADLQAGKGEQAAGSTILVYIYVCIYIYIHTYIYIYIYVLLLLPSYYCKYMFPPTKTLALTLSQTRWCTITSSTAVSCEARSCSTYFLPLPVAKYCSTYRRDGARYEHHYP